MAGLVTPPAACAVPRVTTATAAGVCHIGGGTMRPTLGEPSGLGYVPASMSNPGTEVAVVIRGSDKRAEVVTTPFIRE